MTDETLNDVREIQDNISAQIAEEARIVRRRQTLSSLRKAQDTLTNVLAAAKERKAILKDLRAEFRGIENDPEVSNEDLDVLLNKARNILQPGPYDAGAALNTDIGKYPPGSIPTVMNVCISAPKPARGHR